MPMLFCLLTTTSIRIMERREFLKKVGIAAAAIPCMWLPVQLTGNQPLYEAKFPAFGKPTITDEGMKLLLDCYFHHAESPSPWHLVLLDRDMRPNPYAGYLKWDEDAKDFTNIFGEKEFILATVQIWYGIGLYSISTDTMWSWSAFAKPVKLPIGPIHPGDVRKFDYISYREYQSEFS